MVHSAHLIALRNKHAKLDSQIQQEYARPCPDLAFLTTLKKTKLKLKEAIEREAA